MKNREISITWTVIIIFLMLEVVHPALRGYQHSSVYGSQPNPVREQRLHHSSRKWRNQNREKLKRNNLDLGITPNIPRNLYLSTNDLTNSVQHETCCPTVHEMIQPIAGRNGTGHLVHLYHDVEVHQRFYEVSCHPSIVNKPCKFLERRLLRSSQCVQQHSLTYALVRPTHVTTMDEASWTLDYIIIRSGCTCQVNNTKTIRRRGNDRRF